MLIPDGPDQLTPAWLDTTLGTALDLGGASIAGVETEPIGTGQMCDSYRVRLRWDGPAHELPGTIVAKLPAADPKSRETGKALRAYEAEVRFYQELAARLPVRRPHVHRAEIELDTSAFVLLLEDLAPATQGDQLAGCSVAEARLALDELAKLHAPLWGSAELLDMEWLLRDPDGSRTMLCGLLPIAWDAFLDRYTDRVSAAARQAGQALVAGIESYLTPPPTEQATVVHGDYRLDNLLFGSPGAPVAVVDWQTVGHGRALFDVAYFIGAGLLPADRRANEEALVRRYHQAIVAAGISHYGWDACWRDYRRGTFAGVLMAVIASMLVEQTERGDEMFLTMADRHAAHALDLDATAVLPA